MPVPPQLTTTDVARARQVSLLLGERGAGTVADSVADCARWLGALQSQDHASGLWSLGVRVPGSTLASVSAAIEAGEVLRTWPMRGTIHLVPAEDAGWMLALTGSRTISSLARRRAELGLDDSGLGRAADALRGELSGGRRLTRAEALAVIASTGLPADGQAGYHALVHCSLLGVICIGPPDGTRQTFVSLEEWAPVQRGLDRADALAELARRYFRSHGPTTVADFAGWAGLTLRDARAGVAAGEGQLVPARVGDQEVWMSAAVAEQVDAGLGPQPMRALPGFDEFVLGYKDRTVQIPHGRFEDIVPGGNGVFRSTICVDGRVVGTWTRTVRSDRVDVTVSAFDPLSSRRAATMRRAFDRYGEFLGLPLGALDLA